MIYDTQIISYCYSGHWGEKSVLDAQISSVTASEFLLFHTRENNKADYYVINPMWFGNGPALPSMNEIFKNPKWAKLGARRTDSITIDLNGDFDSYRMFGNEAISEIINNKSMNIFEISIAHMNKNRQRILKEKMEFLLDNNVYCHRLSNNDCELAMVLLSEFTKAFQVKNNIKNTVNDLLILATAINQGLDLNTEDKVLGKFANDHYNAKVIDKSDSVIVSFPSKEETQGIRKKLDSKGYINRGWNFSLRKGNF